MIRYEAPAKVNLALHVRPPRPDGYHPLESLVQTVGWIDEVSIREGERNDSLDVQGIEVASEDNLVLKALAGFRERFEL
ncbi:MAG: 4-(cytidine 5'-diphospho)-2-C-methyl-D-erythritol kinase, partial [Acidimicrobiia bacterium]|nr:4-(cytidine 5'-diphospho)-2-C-methyl-D-erythritol kinase [Acidimicrobiia bacterium]